MKTPTLLLLALLSISCASGSGSKSAVVPRPSAETPREETAALPRPDDDSFEDGTYSNRFFGFRISPPEGWTVASREENSVIQEAGGELIAGDDELRRAAVRAAEKRTTPLLTVSRYPIGARGKPNAVLQMVAEYVPLTVVADAGVYLEIIQESLRTAPAADAYQAQGEIGSATIDGREFATLLYRVELNGQVIWQSYVARKEKLHMLVCVRTWQAESDRQALDEILASLRFS